MGKEVSPLLPVLSAGSSGQGGCLSRSLRETVIIPHPNKWWGLWEPRKGASSNQRSREGILEEVAGVWSMNNESEQCLREFRRNHLRQPRAWTLKHPLGWQLSEERAGPGWGLTARPPPPMRFLFRTPLLPPRLAAGHYGSSYANHFPSVGLITFQGLAAAEPHWPGGGWGRLREQTASPLLPRPPA